MFQNVAAVLFDLDGTLIDSAPDLGAAVDKMRVQRGLPSLPLEHYRPMAGAGARGMIGIAFGITPEHADFEAMKEEFFVNYENCMTERTRIFDGVQDMVAALVSQGLPWGRGDQQVQPLYRSAHFGHALVCYGGRHRQWQHHTACQAPSRAFV